MKVRDAQEACAVHERSGLRCGCNEWVSEMQPGHKAVFSTSSMNREMSRSPRDLVATSMYLNAFRSKNVILEQFKTWW